MPTKALKHLAKKADISVDRAEHLWDKAKDIVDKEYGKKSKGYWALVMGITKKMMGLGEQLTFEEESIARETEMNNILRNLQMAQRCAQAHHWRVKSLSLHLALGELYDLIGEFADELAEMYMGATGETVNPEQSDPNHFSQQDAVEFVQQLHFVLDSLKGGVPPGALMNKYEELQGAVARVKYKVENLK